MSRKARQKQDDDAGRAEVCYWGASFGYSLPKATALLGAQGTAGGHVVVLHLPEAPAAAGGEVHPLRSLAPAARCVLAGGSNSAAPTPPALIVMDLSALFGSPGEAREALDAEGAQAGEPSKALGKPAARALAKLLPQGATLVARGGATQLALKLLCGAGPRLRPGAVSRLLLVHPRLPAECVNTLLVRTRFQQQLSVVFESEEAQARRLPVLQHAFASVGASCACAEAGEALLRGLLCLEASESLPEMPGVTEEDEMGRALWLAHLSIEMDPNSKQYNAQVADASHLLAEEEAQEEEDPTAVDGAPVVAGGEGPAEVAALVVRGCRCVLVRSLDTPPAWRGMRLPSAVALPGEEPQKTAVRAVSELCDIEGESELTPLPLPPVMWYSRHGAVQVYMFSAVHPPPAGPLEEADMEDEEDLYDWYTWPRALRALKGDPAVLMALQSAALALMAASVAGLVPFRWGGIFGQEWTAAINAEGPVASMMARALPQLPAAAPLPKATVAAHPPPASASPEKDRKLLPVTVLSGFLGAGKTTLLKQILRSAGHGGQAVSKADKDGKASEAPLKVGVIVNDMGEVNLDAEEIKSSRLIQEEASMVELHNGCICCTLRGDLLKTVKALSEEEGLDYLVIESTGISEPLPVAQTFVMDVDDAEEAGQGAAATEKGRPAEEEQEGAGGTRTVPPLRSLSHFARLDTMVTVVDAVNIYDVLGSLETLAEKNITSMVGNTGVRGEGDGDGDARKASVAASDHGHGDHGHSDHDHGEETDERSIAQLMLDQIEFANVILLSKAHLVKQGEGAVEEIRALIQKLNPSAQVIVPTQPHFASLPLNAVVNTSLFDMEKAQVSAGWVQELAKTAEGGAGHTPETEEYGISSVVFRDKERPFHPGRLKAVLAGFGNYASSVAAGQSAATGQSGVADGAFSGVVRAKGQLWVASANAHPVDFHAAGRHMELVPSAIPYLAAVPQSEWGEEDREQHEKLLGEGTWHAVHGDRESEAVFIGVALDKTRILAELRAALLTDAEMAGGAAGWKALEDVFFGGAYFEPRLPKEEPDGKAAEAGLRDPGPDAAGE